MNKIEVGQVLKDTESNKYVIEAKLSIVYWRIRFLKSGLVSSVNTSNILNNEVTEYRWKMVTDIAIYDIIDNQNKYNYAVAIWVRIHNEVSNPDKSYTICKEWCKLSNFINWLNDNTTLQSGYDITTQLTNPYNKHYSPEYCHVMPRMMVNRIKHLYEVDVVKDDDQYKLLLTGYLDKPVGKVVRSTSYDVIVKEFVSNGVSILESFTTSDELSQNTIKILLGKTIPIFRSRFAYNPQDDIDGLTVGKVYNQVHGDVIVLGSDRAGDIRVRFLESGAEVSTTKALLLGRQMSKGNDLSVRRLGTVKDPLYRSASNIGINNLSVDDNIYRKWIVMLRNVSKGLYTVDDKWLVYGNFLKWINDHKYEGVWPSGSNTHIINNPFTPLGQLKHYGEDSIPVPLWLYSLLIRDKRDSVSLEDIRKDVRQLTGLYVSVTTDNNTLKRLSMDRDKLILVNNGEGGKRDLYIYFKDTDTLCKYKYL